MTFAKMTYHWTLLLAETWSGSTFDALFNDVNYRWL